MASIVNRLTSRSISGRDLGIDVHMHATELLHFFWKKSGTERCYTHFLERRLLEIEEFTLIRYHIFRNGLSGACECLSTWFPPLEDKHFRSCPFKTANHILFKHYNLSSERNCDYCTCPAICMFGEKTDISTTIFCLSKKSRLTSKTAHIGEHWIRSRSLLIPASRILKSLINERYCMISNSEI
jgi:hypothetical protein